MCTLIIDLPMAVAEKKVRNGMPKCPHVIPFLKRVRKRKDV